MIASNFKYTDAIFILATEQQVYNRILFGVGYLFYIFFFSFKTHLIKVYWMIDEV